jgi:hypothetical protein
LRYLPFFGNHCSTVTGVSRFTEGLCPFSGGGAGFGETFGGVDTGEGEAGDAAAGGSSAGGGNDIDAS